MTITEAKVFFETMVKNEKVTESKFQLMIGGFAMWIQFGKRGVSFIRHNSSHGNETLPTTVKGKLDKRYKCKTWLTVDEVNTEFKKVIGA